MYIHTHTNTLAHRELDFDFSKNEKKKEIKSFHAMKLGIATREHGKSWLFPVGFALPAAQRQKLKRESDDLEEFGHSIRVGISNFQLGCFSRQFNFVVAPFRRRRRRRHHRCRPRFRRWPLFSVRLKSLCFSTFSLSLVKKERKKRED